jgi:hypothetical protein
MTDERRVNFLVSEEMKTKIDDKLHKERLSLREVGESLFSRWLHENQGETLPAKEIEISTSKVPELPVLLSHGAPSGTNLTPEEVILTTMLIEVLRSTKPGLAGAIRANIEQFHDWVTLLDAARQRTFHAGPIGKSLIGALERLRESWADLERTRQELERQRSHFERATREIERLVTIMGKGKEGPTEPDRSGGAA